jgi:hypothetical protein
LDTSVFINLQALVANNLVTYQNSAVRGKLAGGRIEEAKIAAVVPHEDGVRLQVDFGHDETALIELWQVVED